MRSFNKTTQTQNVCILEVNQFFDNPSAVGISFVDLSTESNDQKSFNC